MSDTDVDPAEVEESTSEVNEEVSALEISSSDIPSTWYSFLFNSFCTLLYGYAIYFQSFNCKAVVLNEILDPALRIFGKWKFLTYNSLIMQFLSSSLHLLSLIKPECKPVRDVVFASLAYPIGSLVQYTFWTVWFAQGRDLIFPRAIEPYYPTWLNHVTHTIIVPVNVWQAFLTYHSYYRKGYLATFLFLLTYAILTVYIRWRAGLFVYPFMNEMSNISVIIYFASVLFSSIALYESGFFITGIFHLKKLRRFTR